MGSEKLIPLKTFKFLPEMSDRQAWDAIKNDPTKKKYIDEIFREAELAATTPIPIDSAKLFMEFHRTGKRTAYEANHFARRARLVNLVLAEALEYKGRFIDDIIEHLYALEAEYTWTIPAHDAEWKDPLPCYKYEEIDLFSSETSNLVAQTLAISEKEIAKVSPNFVKRLKEKVMARAIVPIEENLENYWWIDLVSNWNPWICSNLIWAGNYMLQGDDERFTKFANKLLAITEKYYAAYPEDGACEEGAMYFSRSPVNYFFILDAMYRASDGKFNRFNEPKLRKMFEFIAAANMGEDYFATFSDARKKVGLSSGVIYAMADRVGSNELKAFSSNFNPYSNGLDQNDSMGYLLPYYQLVSKVQTEKCDNDFFFVYPKTEHAYLKNGDTALAIKGGHNMEEHNHIDVGQFILKFGDRTAAIDLGAPEYTRDYHSKENRYKNFVANSFGHNHLIFNGVGQSAGKEFRTRKFETKGDFKHAEIEIDLTPAYPAEVKLKSYIRKLIFDNGVLTVIDEFEAEEALEAMMIIYSEFEKFPGTSSTKIVSEKYNVTDSGLKITWGDTLYKHTIKLDKTQKGIIKTVFKQQ